MATHRLRRVLATYGASAIACAFSGGNDALVVLHLLKTLAGGRVPCKVIRVATDVDFPELTAFADELSVRWTLDIILAREDDIAAHLRSAADPFAYYADRKRKAIARAMAEHGLRVLLSGERREEPIIGTPLPGPLPYCAIRPLWNWRSADVWRYLQRHELPYCTLYDQGYRRAAGIPCLDGARPGDSTIVADDTAARRAIEERLRGLGYF